LNFFLVVWVVVQVPLRLGSLMLGAGSFRITCVQGERLGSLITHISRVPPMFAWDGPVGKGGVRINDQDREG